MAGEKQADFRIYGDEAKCRSTVRRHIKRAEELLDQAEGVKRRVEAAETPLNAAVIEQEWVKEVRRWFISVNTAVGKFLQDQFPGPVPVIAYGLPPDTGKPRHMVYLENGEPWLRKAVEELEGFEAALAARQSGSGGGVIKPGKPYSNLLRLREILRDCRAHIWWADPHFSKQGLEPLADEARADRVQEIRILSGPEHVGAAAADYERFKKEMDAAGISVEWRVVERGDRDWHDRFIVTKGRAWNVPPINTLMSKGDYSVIAETEPPPFERWWEQGAPV